MPNQTPPGARKDETVEKRVQEIFVALGSYEMRFPTQAVGNKGRVSSFLACMQACYNVWMVGRGYQSKGAC